MRQRRNSPKKSTEPRPSLWRRLTGPQRALAAIIGTYVVVFFGMAQRCYDVFGYDSGATAVYNNMLWWTLHGKPFLIAAMITSESAKPISNLAAHAAYFWVFILPFYALFPGPSILFFLQALALGMAAVPMYLIARKLLEDEVAAVLLAAAYLLLPPLVSQNLNQVQEPCFLPVLLLFVFYFFLERRYGLFLSFSAVALLNRENVPLAIMMFGVWALVERRSWKWVVVPIVCGAAYFWFVTFVAMPYFRQGENWHVARMFGYLGSSAGEIFKNAALHPLVLVQHLFSSDNVRYVIFLVQPLGWILPFFALPCLVALPDLAINLLSENTALKVIPWHYNVLTGTALFVSTLFAVRKIGLWQRRKYGEGRYLPVVACGLLVLSAAHWFLWFQPGYLRELPYQQALNHAIESIPKDVSVLSSVRIQARFSGRPRYDSLNVFEHQPEYAKTFDYVLLDANERRFPPFVTQEFFDSFYKNPRYQLIFAEQNVFVFHRLGGESDWKAPPPS
jgi:uncharacterized membrane protein